MLKIKLIENPRDNFDVNHLFYTDDVIYHYNDNKTMKNCFRIKKFSEFGIAIRLKYV